jgi:hypothetical protein
MPELTQKPRLADPNTGFDAIARRLGRQLRDLYPNPETEALPIEQVQMLLQLRHKERNIRR